MKILFLHSGLEITGAITYTRTLEKTWGERHRVYWVSDVPLSTPEQSLVLPMRYKLFPNGILNAWAVARAVREWGIDILHAHSRRANMVAAMASRVTGVPYVTTAHMRTPPQIYNYFWPCWGFYTFAICEKIAEHLEQKNKIPLARIAMIRNGIDLDHFPPVLEADTSERWITVLGRLSGKRWAAVRFLLSLASDLLAAYPDVRFRFIGHIPDEHRLELETLLEKINTGFTTPRVIAPGNVEDPRTAIASSCVVIGAGRSLLESMAMGVPAVAVGERSSYGLITAENFTATQAGNFGDFSIPSGHHFNRDIVVQGLQRVLDKRIDLPAWSHWARERVYREYNIEHAADQTEAVYKMAVAPKPWKDERSLSSSESKFDLQPASLREKASGCKS